VGRTSGQNQLLKKKAEPDQPEEKRNDAINDFDAKIVGPKPDMVNSSKKPDKNQLVAGEGLKRRGTNRTDEETPR